MSYPIIFAPDGTILDGIHRIVRARIEKKQTLKAVQFDELPVADRQYVVNPKD